MNFNSFLIVSCIVFLTACGGNKAGSLTLKEPTPISAPITAQTPDPNASPAPDPSATPVSSSTPTPTPGDWNSATDLSQAIYDITTYEPWTNHFTFEVEYYDLDHLGPNPHTFSKKVLFSFVNTDPNGTHDTYWLNSNISAFTGSWIECTHGCQGGVLHLIYSGPQNSRLNGSADVDFFRKKLLKTKYELGHLTATDVTELNFILTLQTNWLFDGRITAFNVRNGFAQPYEVLMQLGKIGQTFFTESSAVHGRKTGEGQVVRYHFSSPLLKFDEYLGRAKVSTDFTSDLLMCFQTTRRLGGFGAYTTKNQPPADPCAP